MDIRTYPENHCAEVENIFACEHANDDEMIISETPCCMSEAYQTPNTSAVTLQSPVPSQLSSVIFANVHNSRRTSLFGTWLSAGLYNPAQHI